MSILGRTGCQAWRHFSHLTARWTATAVWYSRGMTSLSKWNHSLPQFFNLKPNKQVGGNSPFEHFVPFIFMKRNVNARLRCKYLSVLKFDALHRHKCWKGTENGEASEKPVWALASFRDAKYSCTGKLLHFEGGYKLWPHSHVGFTSPCSFYLRKCYRFYSNSISSGPCTMGTLWWILKMGYLTKKKKSKGWNGDVFREEMFIQNSWKALE